MSNPLEPARAELRTAAIAFAALFEASYDDDALVNALARLEVAAKAFADSRLTVALEESLKLQSHYAKLLNMHDGGERMGFKNSSEWLARLERTKNAAR